MKIYDITAFGGVSGGADCGPALEQALRAIRNSEEAATLLFPKGEYHFYKDTAPVRRVHTSNTDSCDYPEKHCGFLIEHMAHLTVDGQGSLFLFHGNMQALTVLHSKHITLQNFAWDFAVPTTVELIVKERGRFHTVFEIPEPFQWSCSGRNLTWYEESPLDGHRYWQWRNQEKVACLVGIDPLTRNCCRAPIFYGPLFAQRKVTRLGDHTVRVDYWWPAPSYHTPGRIIQLCQNRRRECAGAFLWESEDIRLTDVQVHYMNGFGFLTQMCRDVQFLRCRFVPRTELKKQCTSFADLIHVSGAAGRVEVLDCTFCNAHDDPINIHGTFTRVVKRLDDKTLCLEYVHRQQGGFPQFHVGDQVAFYSRDTLSSIDGEQEHFYTVASCTNPGEDGNTDKTMTVTFTETLPRQITDSIGGEKKYVAENVTYTPQVTIRGCRMSTIPTRGILCTTRGKTVIEDNVFDGMTMASIFLSNDSNEWYESGPIRDMTIRHNTFYICKAPQREWADKGGIYIHPVTKGKKLPGWEHPVHRNITITGNTFYMEHDQAVKAESVENLTIRDNRILRYERTKQDAAINAFELIACKNVTISGNTADDTVTLRPVLRAMPPEQVHGS